MSRSPASNLTIENRSFAIINYLFLFAVLAAIIFPILLVVIVSLKTMEEYQSTSVFQLPRDLLNFDNYRLVLEKANFILGARNTLQLIVASVSSSVLMGTMVAYILGRFEFRMKKFVLMAFLVPTFIPYMTTAIATFTVIKNLHLYNTIYAGIILYMGANIVGIYIFLQYIDNIPDALDESARIDGASYFRIYWSIILPQMKSAITTIAIIQTIGVYNDFFTPYLYMPKSSLRTISTSLSGFASDRGADWPLMSAGIVLVALPTLVVFLFLQRYIISGITEGSVKS